MTKADLLRILSGLPMQTEIAIGQVGETYADPVDSRVYQAYTFTGIHGLTLILTDGVFVPEADDLESVT